MVDYLQCEHHLITLNNQDLANALYMAVDARDLPGMADCDSSLVYFCREVKKRHTGVLSGECSDEIFGGYPWFRDPDAFRRDAFPWCYDLSMREDILCDSVKRTLKINDYAHARYCESIAQTPLFDGEDLVAQGVLMEGWSVEDEGEGVCFCVYAYNNQPGIVIDYATGESSLIEA